MDALCWRSLAMELAKLSCACAWSIRSVFAWVSPNRDESERSEREKFFWKGVFLRVRLVLLGVIVGKR